MDLKVLYSKSSLLSLEKYADSVSCKEFFVYLTPILTHPFGYATETTLLFLVCSLETVNPLNWKEGTILHRIGEKGERSSKSF